MLFIKFTLSFVAIELMTLCKMQDHYFIAQESSRYSVRKQDWFFCFLCIKKMFRKKNGFCVCMKITITAIIKRQRARFYPQKKRKIAKHLNTKIHTLFKKLDNSRYVFIHKKSYTLRYGIFMNFWSVHFNTKNMTLCVTRRFYK